jgi:hypothetical protein
LCFECIIVVSDAGFNSNILTQLERPEITNFSASPSSPSPSLTPQAPSTPASAPASVSASVSASSVGGGSNTGPGSRSLDLPEQHRRRSVAEMAAEAQENRHWLQRIDLEAATPSSSTSTPTDPLPPTPILAPESPSTASPSTPPASATTAHVATFFATNEPADSRPT